MVIIAFHILTFHLELILTTNQGNGHEYVQVYVSPVFLIYFYYYYYYFYFFNVSEGKEIKRDEKFRYNVKDNNENRILHYSIQFLLQT